MYENVQRLHPFILIHALNTICPSIQKKLKNLCVFIVYLSCAFNATLHYFYLFIYIERQIAPLFNITKTVISNYYFVNFAIMIQRLPDNLLVFQYALMIMFGLNKYIFFLWIDKKKRRICWTQKKKFETNVKLHHMLSVIRRRSNCEFVSKSAWKKTTANKNIYVKLFKGTVVQLFMSVCVGTWE